MTVCREASSPANAARSATVLPAPTSPVITPSAVSLMHQRIRATASACPPWRCSIAGARSRRNSGAVEPEVGAQLVQAHRISSGSVVSALVGAASSAASAGSGPGVAGFDQPQVVDAGRGRRRCGRGAGLWVDVAVDLERRGPAGIDYLRLVED